MDILNEVKKAVLPDVTDYKFKVGDLVRIPRCNLGHDTHNPTYVFKITHRYPGHVPSYQVKGSPSLWPEPRLVLVTRSLTRK